MIMRGFLTLSIFLSMSLYAFNSKIKVSVQSTDTGEFSGFLWSDVDETVGDGDSPMVTANDVMTALRTEFTDPKAALAQLERLKQSSGGEIVMNFYYHGRSEKSPRLSGDLGHRCGILNKANPEDTNMYIAWGGGLSSGTANQQALREYGDPGKFFQFKWASRAQIRRFIARCFARLPGMPALKEHRPQDSPQLYIPTEMYNDLFRWMSMFPGISRYSANHPKFRSAAKCLVSNASNYIPDRTGNAVVLQRQENDEDDEDDAHQSAIVSEMNYLPGHVGIRRAAGKNNYNYSISFMDQTSTANVRSHWEKDQIQNLGIWPNFQGASVASVLAQVYGGEFLVNVKACLLSAGIQVPNPNEYMPTVYNPFSCKEVDMRSIDINEYYDILCINGNANSCFSIGSNFEQGKSYLCMPPESGGRCTLGAGIRDMEKAKQYYSKACDLGLAKACTVRGRFDNDALVWHSGTPTKNSYLIRGCELKNSPRCAFDRLGIPIVNERNLADFQYACNMFITSRSSCTSLGVYYLINKDEKKAQEFFKRGCRLPTPDSLPDENCIQLEDVKLSN